MSLDFDTLLHPRVVRRCRKLFLDGHWKHAAHEAMTQVELALKEKSGVKKLYGVRLVTSLLGKGKGLKLRVPFGDELQEKVEKFFSGSFSYYRNYAAHDGSKIDQSNCLRILVIASELLDLVGVSNLSFVDVGGVDGLVKQGVFRNALQLHEFLRFLDGQTFPDETVDGFFEDLAERGFSEEQVQAVVETDLIEYITEPYTPSELDRLDDMLCPDTISWFQLTKLGKDVIGEKEGRAI